MAPRNNQWTLLGLDTDPVPGDPAKLDYLISRMHSLADDADRARSGVVGLLADRALNGWMGASGDAFRAACEPLPDHLQKLRQSYEDAASALTAYQKSLGDARSKSATAVGQGVSAYGKYNCLGDGPPCHKMDDGEYQRWVDKLGRDLMLQQQKNAPAPSSRRPDTSRRSSSARTRGHRSSGR
ncbi:WXG100 family type VII secretion target [Catenulispora yoronensis]